MYTTLLFVLRRPYLFILLLWSFFVAMLFGICLTTQLQIFVLQEAEAHFGLTFLHLFTFDGTYLMNSYIAMFLSFLSVSVTVVRYCTVYFKKLGIL